MKRKQAKSKGEKERYKHLNAEFQRLVRRDKKAFLSDQRKEIEENNRMGKTRDLLKKIRDTKGTFHTKMGSLKDRNSFSLVEPSRSRLRRGGKNSGVGCHFLLQGIVPTHGSNRVSCASFIAGRLFAAEPQGKPLFM